MKYLIEAPDILDTTIELPSSKSISNRALIISAMASAYNNEPLVLPDNLSDCDDTEVVVNALKNMPETIDIKAAGTAMRFMTAWLCICEGQSHTITGTERMRHRPIKILVDVLRHLGADIEYTGEEGYPPLKIKGKKIKGGRISIPGNISSQYISALLMIGPMLKKGLELKLTGEIASRPYIDLTLWTMKEYGADADWTDMDTITVKPQPYKETPYMIENDWSASSYWYEMMALNANIDSSIELEGLMDSSKQGDSVVKYIFSLLGVKSEFENRDTITTVTLKTNRCLLPKFEYDFSGSPDLAQTIVVACCALGVKFKFTGLASLKIKETDRIEALKTELKKVGYVIHDENDNTLYTMDTWMSGYLPFMRFSSDAPDTQIDYMTYKAENAVVSPIAGFIFDASNVQTELSNLQTEIIASIYPIKVGMVSYEDNIDQAIANLKAAGLDTYLNEYRTQFSAYLEANPWVLEMAK